jgi:hypothetical protein
MHGPLEADLCSTSLLIVRQGREIFCNARTAGLLFMLSQVPKGEGVKCRDMVYILSPDILYSFPMLG